MSNSINASSVSLVDVNDKGLLTLPTRGEKVFAPQSVPAIISLPVVQEGLQSLQQGGNTLVPSTEDALTLAALGEYYTFVLVRIPGRGATATGIPDPQSSAYFQFLVNPTTMQVNYQAVDAQSLTRAGWQMGVWGEDFINITLEGTTPGRYFSLGLTDTWAPYTVSYRNLEALEIVVENNGYWFEGEQAYDGLLSNKFTHRQIKMHSDVELMVGEFIWSGMFEGMNITEDADEPFLARFSLNFTAWREHYRKVTPYPSPISDAVARGHTPAASFIYSAANNANSLYSMTNSQIPVLQSPSVTTLLSGAVPSNVSPSSAIVHNLPALPTLPQSDSTPVANIFSTPGTGSGGGTLNFVETGTDTGNPNPPPSFTASNGAPFSSPGFFAS